MRASALFGLGVLIGCGGGTPPTTTAPATAVQPTPPQTSATQAPSPTPTPATNEPKFRGKPRSHWIEQLADRATETQIDALAAIEGFGPDAAIAAPRVYELWVEGANQRVTDAAEAALAALGDAGAAQLTSALDDRDIDLQARAVAVLAEMPGQAEAAKRALVRVMAMFLAGDEKRAVASQAFRKLDKIGRTLMDPREDRAAMERLMLDVCGEMLGDTQDRVQIAGIKMLTLAGAKAKELLPTLRAVKGSPAVQRVAEEAIKAIESGRPVAGLLRSRIGTNESAAIGTLRSLSTAQEQFRQQCIVDQDADGMGEFGFLGELAGNAECRVTKLKMNASPFIAAILGVRDANGFAQKAGYYYVMYLPGRTGVLTEAGGWDGNAAPEDSAAANNQEVRWICYAWPNSIGQSGNRAFMVNHAGDVWATPNTAAGQKYSGAKNFPKPGAALDANGNNPKNLDAGVGMAAAGLTAGDGGLWVPAGN